MTFPEGEFLRFPVRVWPEAGESAKGYLLRVAKANGYYDATWFLPSRNAIRADPTLLPTESELLTVLSRSGAGRDQLGDLGSFRDDGPNNLSSTVRLVSGVKSSSDMIDGKRAKVCPVCIGQKSIVYSAWDNPHWVACPTHGCHLVNFCSDCGKEITWRRPNIERCGCSEKDFSASKLSPAPTNTVDLLRLLARMLNFPSPPPSEALLKIAGHLTAEQLCSLIRLLAASVDRQAGVKHPSTRSHPDLATATSSFVIASNALANWPFNFHHFIRGAKVSPGEGITLALYREFRTLAIAFNKALSDKAFDFVRTEFFDFVNVAYPGWTSRISKRASAPAKSTITPRDAAEILGVSIKSVLHYIESGHLRGNQTQRGERKVCLLDKQEVLDVKAKHYFGMSRKDAVINASAITVKDAAALLGISNRATLKLYDSGFLGERNVSVQFYKYSSKSALTAFLDRISTIPIEGSAQQDTGMRKGKIALQPLTSVLQKGFGPSFPDILDAIFSKRLAPVQIDKTAIGLQSFLYSAKTLNELVDKLSHPDDLITQSGAIRLLGLDYKCLLNLEKDGFVKRAARPQFKCAPPPCTVYYDRSSLIKFASTFVSTGELSQIFGRQHRQIRYRLVENGFEPAIKGAAPTNTFWNREAAQQLLGSKALIWRKRTK